MRDAVTVPNRIELASLNISSHWFSMSFCLIFDPINGSRSIQRLALPKM